VRVNSLKGEATHKTKATEVSAHPLGDEGMEKYEMFKHSLINRGYKKKHSFYVQNNPKELWVKQCLATLSFFVFTKWIQGPPFACSNQY